MTIDEFIAALDQFTDEEKKVLSDMFDECQFQSDVDSMLKCIEEETGFYSDSVGITPQDAWLSIAFRMIAGPQIRLKKDEIEALLTACRPYLEAD